MDQLRKYIRKILCENMSLFQGVLNEKLMLKNWDEYVSLVTNAYNEAPDYDASVVGHWSSLNSSNYTLFKRLLSKVDVVFVTNDKSKIGKINILGKDFKIEYIKPGDEYKTQSEMKQSFTETGVLKISIDYSNHPVFSVADNIVFRTVHDYIVHILGGHDFGAKGEIASYNRHAKLAPKEAIPALFTEVIGQASTTLSSGSFPKQKIAILKGFDYKNVGIVDDENYEIINKTLIKKSGTNQSKIEKEKKIRQEPVAVRELEPELYESFDKSEDYKKWKRKNVTLRGMSQGVGNENNGGARFGSGLYTASLGNKQMAKGYGDVYFVVNGRPKNPVKFNDTNQAEIWLFRNITNKNYKSIRDFNKDTTIEAEMLKLGYDGLEVVGREIVSYKPENVLYFSNERQLIGYYEDTIESKEPGDDLIKEKFNVTQNTLELSVPYDDIEKIRIGNRVVYVLFGNVDYYQNKEAILAIKRKSSKLNLDNKYYNGFLQEFKKRFFSIGDLSKTDLLVSVETTGPINNEMSNALQIPYIKDGFKKNNPLFKMKDIDLQNRGSVKDLFNLDFQLDENKVICIMDDFITSGTTFKNAFDKLHEGVEVVGVCLFKLNS